MRLSLALPLALAVTLALALGGCRSVVVAPSPEPGKEGIPPVGQVPWLAAPGPGWTTLVREEGNSVVMVNDASITREGDRRRALLLINYIHPVQDVAGRPIRSELAALELACTARQYRLPSRRLFETHGATGETLLERPHDAAMPMRPVIAGSIAENLLEALCAPPRATP